MGLLYRRCADEAAHRSIHISSVPLRARNQEEHDHRNFVYWLARVRGYKFMDDYADHLGFGEQNYGASVLCVVDPDADKLNAMTCFADPHEGVDFLKFKRRKL